MTLKEIMRYVDEEGVSDEEGFRLIKDNDSFDLRLEKGHLRPVGYELRGKFLGEHSIFDLSQILREYEFKLAELNGMNGEFVISMGKFPLDIWIDIIRRELMWRDKTDNV